MELKKRYQQFSRDFQQFRFEHKLGGGIVVFLMDMGIWNLASTLSNDPYVSSFYTHFFMSILLTLVFYVGRKPK